MADVAFFFIGIVLGFSLCLAVIADEVEARNTIIKHGYAEYNKETGKFQWIKEKR